MADHDLPPAAETVRRFLRLVEARDLDQAAGFLSPQAKITFPGGRVFASLEEQVASSAGRFRSVQKTFERFDVAPGPDDADETVVYAFGTLRGEALDNTSFEGVRFIDRFTLRAGKIVDQRVWNDLAEEGVIRSLSSGGDSTVN